MEPEESLLDFHDHPKIEKQITGSHFKFIFFTVIGLSILAGYGFWLGVVKGESFLKLSQENIFIRYSSRPPRGIIYDKNGVALTSNSAVFNLLAFNHQLPRSKAERQEVYKELAGILGEDENKLAGEVEGQLGQAVILIKEAINKNEVLKIETKKLPGIVIQTNSKREYAKNPLMPHILGYAGFVSRADLEKDSFYDITDTIGKSGLEQYYEEYLRGRRGEVIFNKLTNEYEVSESQSGLNLVLNIDAELQNILASSLKSALRQVPSTSSGQGKKAAAIIQNPQNGRVLALVSLPDFDNNIFSSKISQDDFFSLFKNPNQPLLNRVTNGRFSPGSTVKPLMAVAALEENIISPLKRIFSSGSISLASPFDSSVVFTFRDWKAHGWVDMRRAIAVSSDVYFYHVGGGYEDVRGLGIDRMAQYMTRFLADKKLGIDLPSETAGFVPSKEWKLKTKNEPWYTGDSYNVSIGQGDVIVTPLWLNSYISAIANNGTIYKPQIVDKVLDNNKNAVTIFKSEKLAENLGDKNNIKIAREGMRMAVEDGTAQILKGLPVQTAAKTGTAEVIKNKSTNAWFTAFAPYDNPEIAITVLIEAGADGSNLPSQVAFNVLQYYFKTEISP